MKGIKLFFVIYAFIVFQLYLGISNNKTKSIFGVCTNELLDLNLDLRNNMLANYIRSLYYKKIGHILQGLLLGIILLFNYNISNHIDIIFNNSTIICKNNMYKNIIVTILTIILLTLWQIDLMPFILPAIMILYLIKIVLKSCDQMQFNILLLLISCGYLLYNMGKRGYYYSNFIESSYFSNLFDFFMGMTISIISYLLFSKNTKTELPLNNKFIYLILLVFFINTLVVMKLISFSKSRLTQTDSIQEIQSQCVMNKL
tara:strand:+ start:326 stop:1099 length:774 start_codon:yes stop_codon:yes gene_type:complete